VRQQSARLLAAYVYASCGSVRVDERRRVRWRLLDRREWRPPRRGRGGARSPGISSPRISTWKSYSTSALATSPSPRQRPAATPHETHELGGSRKLRRFAGGIRARRSSPKNPSGSTRACVKSWKFINRARATRALQAARKSSWVGVRGRLDSTPRTGRRRGSHAPPRATSDLRRRGEYARVRHDPNKTRALAKALSSALGVVFREISIKASVSQHFITDIGHDPTLPRRGVR